MVCVIAPVFQTFPVTLLELNTTLPPAQNVVGPPAVMVGVSCTGLTLTLTEVVGELHPLGLETNKEYVPLEFTIMEVVVSPVLQLLLEALDEVSVVVSPEHIEFPVLVILGVVGIGNTLTLKFVELTLHVPAPDTTE
jgi:hypothetical protein